MILTIIKFGELLLGISLIINALRSYVKHSKECFIRYPNTSKSVKKNSAASRFFNPLKFSVFGYLMKHSSLCLICYVTSASFVQHTCKDCVILVTVY